MVTTSRLAAGLSGLRNRNTRVTNKTLLRVVKGNIEADTILLDDEDDEKNRVLASHGVEEEDAHEHHLQAALFASSQRLSAAQTKPDNTAFIPTPDATGVITNYDELYPPKRYKDPLTHIRSSESIDEACVGGLSNSFTYYLDERDLEWLNKHNCTARGEGTSANGTALNGIEHSPKTAHRVVPPRSSKSKGKEPDTTSFLSVNCRPVPIDEDQFELVMGLFEKWTDEHVSPYLHLASDPEHFPSFNEYMSFFSKPLPSAVFANFEIPSYGVPPPDKLTDIARCIYPWWKERRIERKGQRIVPQLHILVIDAQEKEDKTGGSPYTCFRKREVKPMRRTRTNNVIHTDKLARLREELHRGLELSRMVVMREKLKYDMVKNSIAVWQKRESLSELMKQLNTLAPGSVPPTDEHLLHDRDKKRKRPEPTAPARIVLPNRRPHSLPRDSADPYSALSLSLDNSVAFEEGQKWPTARTLGIQREVEKTLAKIRKEDAFWEDLLDFPYLSSPTSTEKYLKLFPAVEQSAAAYRNDNIPPLRGRSMRLRTGRGGRIHIDRRFHISQPRLLQRERATHPLQREEIVAQQEHAERWNSRSWRPLEADFKLRRVMPELGAVYLSHPSIYNAQNGDSMEVDNQGQLDAILDSERNMHAFDKLDTFHRPIHGDGSRSVHDRSSDTATRSVVDKIQEVETWRGLTAESTPGGALALFTDGGDPMEHSGKGTQRSEYDLDDWPFVDLSRDSIERAWRNDDRWRYDENVCHEDSDDRFIMDDFQAKFLRTSITLLDSADHDMLKIDPHLLPPIPAKPSRYLDHQLRQSGLSQLSSIPHRPQIPPRLPSQTHIPQNPAIPRTDVTPIRNPPQVNGRMMNGATDHQQLQTLPMQNGITPVPSSGARLPPDSGPVARISTLVRHKQTPNGLGSSQTPSPETPGAPTQASVNGSAPFATANGASPVKSNDLIATPQIPSQQLTGRPVTIGTGENSPERGIGLPLGVGNLQLKLPSQQNGTMGNSLPNRSTPGFHNSPPMYWPPGAVDLTNTFY